MSDCEEIDPTSDSDFRNLSIDEENEFANQTSDSEDFTASSIDEESIPQKC